jgi:hypothetical protein
VTTKRPVVYENSLGCFRYQNIKRSLFWGYQATRIKQQTAFMAKPEKALLDLIYLRPGNISMPFLEEMRFQNMQMIDIHTLELYAKKFNKPKITKAVRMIVEYLRNDTGSEASL